jgi:hypothetical protein
MADNPATAVSALAYERAAAVLDHQRARLSEIRTNSSILLAATALAASFLGDWSLDKGEGAFAGLALGAFVLGILCGIAPVWPVIQTPRAGLRGVLSRLVSPGVALRLTGGLSWRRGPTAQDVLAMDHDGVGSAYATLAVALSDCVPRRTTRSSTEDRHGLWPAAFSWLLKSYSGSRTRSPRPDRSVAFHAKRSRTRGASSRLPA